MTEDQYKSLEIDAAELYLLRKQKETIHQNYSAILKIILLTIPLLFAFFLFLILG